MRYKRKRRVSRKWECLPCHSSAWLLVRLDTCHLVYKHDFRQCRRGGRITPLPAAMDRARGIVLGAGCQRSNRGGSTSVTMRRPPARPRCSPGTRLGAWRCARLPELLEKGERD
jgi:hypothetical protein